MAGWWFHPKVLALGSTHFYDWTIQRAIKLAVWLVRGYPFSSKVSLFGGIPLIQGALLKGHSVCMSEHRATQEPLTGQDLSVRKSAQWEPFETPTRQRNPCQRRTRAFVSVVLFDYNFQSVRIVRSSIKCTSTGTDGKRIRVRSAITAKTC